jgi:hypothetical protein
MGEQMALYSSSASGCEWEKIFDNSAFGYWLLAFGQKKQHAAKHGAFTLQPSACLGLGLGLGLGDPWVTQAPPKGHARATQAPSKGRFG